MTLSKKGKRRRQNVVSMTLSKKEERRQNVVWR